MASRKRSMNAIRVAKFGSSKVMKLDSNAAVPTPGEGEVLVKVHAAGVNPIDTFIRNGQSSNLPKLPYTPGFDCAGVVEAVGPGVTKYKAGDRVYTFRSISGTYGEYALSAEQYTFSLHPNLSFSQGAAIGIPYFAAYRAIIIRGNAKSGETLLVHGASGGVGVAACQIGKAFGMRVLGTAGTEKGLALVKKIGAEKAFNHKKKGYIKEIKNCVGQKGVDVIVELQASANLESDLDLLGRNGRVMIVGGRDSANISPWRTMGNESDIRGVAVLTGSAEEFEQIAAALWEGQEKGWLNPVIGTEFPLSDADKAHEEVMEHSQGSAGKIVLHVQ